jgi:hypothetical protein
LSTLIRGARNERGPIFEADRDSIGGCCRTISSTSSSTSRPSASAFDRGEPSTSMGLLLNAQMSMIIVTSVQCTDFHQASNNHFCQPQPGKFSKERTGTAGVRCKDEEVHDTNIAHSAQGAYGLGVWGQGSLGSFGLDRVRGVRVAGVVFWTCTARQPCRSGNAPLAVRGW